tara:strand:+ start:2244 stop:2819 length:576 start_codon:yes stop_codon:yes gene_type:complete
MDWREKIVATYSSLPRNVAEGLWRVAILGIAVASSLMGIVAWRSPEIILGVPRAERSPIDLISEDEKLKDQIYALMDRFYLTHRPYGLMLVSWEEIDSLVGIWVRPADKFPGKSGPHQLTPDLRVLSGPFIFGECADVESLAVPGKQMVACPINSTYDAWGYVAAVVDAADVEKTQRLLSFLAHRITQLIY